MLKTTYWLLKFNIQMQFSKQIVLKRTFYSLNDGMKIRNVQWLLEIKENADEIFPYNDYILLCFTAGLYCGTLFLRDDTLFVEGNNISACNKMFKSPTGHNLNSHGFHSPSHRYLLFKILKRNFLVTLFFLLRNNCYIRFIM